MAGCIEDLFTQCLGDFDRLKGLDCPPVKDRFQDVAHEFLHVAITTYICCNATYKKAMLALGSLLRYSEKRLLRLCASTPAPELNTVLIGSPRMRTGSSDD